MSRPIKKEIDDVFYVKDNWIPYFKIPLSFQIHQSTMSKAEKDIYIFFMIQVSLNKSLEIEASNEIIRYWTGMKSELTVRGSIRGLAEQGWINDIVYQKRGSNIYLLNLEPKVSHELLDKMDRRSRNTSKAKKKSIRKGENGKFKPKVENDENL